MVSAHAAAWLPEEHRHIQEKGDMLEGKREVYVCRHVCHAYHAHKCNMACHRWKAMPRKCASTKLIMPNPALVEQRVEGTQGIRRS